MKRRTNGRYSARDFTGAYMLGTTLLIGTYLQNQKKIEDILFPLDNPYVAHYFAPQVEATGWIEAKPIPLDRLSEELAPEPTKAPKQAVSSNYDDLLIKYFGDEWKIARAIAMAESHMNWSREGIHRAGRHSWSSEDYKGECSIGGFQVNIAADACNGKKVHWSKIPGETLEDKIAWLKVPENNIKIAYEIYKARGNFTAWSTYTNGKYKEWMH